MSDNNRPSREVALDSLRGLACLSVVIFHGLYWLEPLLRQVSENGTSLAFLMFGGASPVAFFFVLSGYVLTKSLARGSGRQPLGHSLGHYFARRILRLMPMHWLTLAAFLIVLSVFPRVDHALSPKLFLLLDSPLDSVRILANALLWENDINAVSWSLQSELVASAFLPLFWWAIYYGGTAASVLLGVGLLGLAWLTPDPAWRYLFAFFLGACGTRIPPRWIGGQGSPLLGISAMLILAGLLFVGRHGQFDGGYLEVLGLAVLSLFMVQVVRAAAEEKRFSWLRRPEMVRLGDYSYSIYLIHLPVLYVVSQTVVRLLGNETVAAHAILVFFGVTLSTLVISITLAAGSYRWLELALLNSYDGHFLPRRASQPTT